ncbi:hypothetical protein D3C80_1525400 [compost metagenome]
MTDKVRVHNHIEVALFGRRPGKLSPQLRDAGHGVLLIALPTDGVSVQGPCIRIVWQETTGAGCPLKNKLLQDRLLAHQPLGRTKLTKGKTSLLWRVELFAGCVYVSNGSLVQG